MENRKNKCLITVLIARIKMDYKSLEGLKTFSQLHICHPD